MAKEKEAATATSSFASFENLITVCLWTHTFFKNRVVNKVIFESLHEQFALVENNFDIRSQGHFYIFVLRAVLYIDA